MTVLDHNTVDIIVRYATSDNPQLQKTYTAPFNPDTGVQQYLDYYQAGFIHDHPEATKMEIASIMAYHNDNPMDTHMIYESSGKHVWFKE